MSNNAVPCVEKESQIISYIHFQQRALALFLNSGLYYSLTPKSKEDFDKKVVTIEDLLLDPGIRQMLSDASVQHSF